MIGCEWNSIINVTVAQMFKTSAKPYTNASEVWKSLLLLAVRRRTAPFMFVWQYSSIKNVWLCWCESLKSRRFTRWEPIRLTDRRRTVCCYLLRDTYLYIFEGPPGRFLIHFPLIPSSSTPAVSSLVIRRDVVVSWK